MLTRIFLTSVLIVHITQGQNFPTQSNRDNDAAVFQAAVAKGLLPGDTYAASAFVLNHESTAIPILVAAIKEHLARNDRQGFPPKAAELIAYAASESAMDAIADLCPLDWKQFSPYVKRLLDHAINRDREYAVVYHAVDTDPQIRDVVVAWLVESLAFPQADVALAKEVLRREKSGHPLKENDSVWAGLPPTTRVRVLRAIDTVKADELERQRRGQ